MQTFVETVMEQDQTESLVLNDILCSLVRTGANTDADIDFKMENILRHPKFALSEKQIMKNALYMFKGGMFEHVEKLKNFIKIKSW